MILIPIASNMYEADGNRDRSCVRSRDSNMLIGSTKHKSDFVIKINFTLCMYMHRSSLVYIYINI